MLECLYGHVFNHQNYNRSLYVDLVEAYEFKIIPWLWDYVFVLGYFVPMSSIFIITAENVLFIYYIIIMIITQRRTLGSDSKLLTVSQANYPGPYFIQMVASSLLIC